MLFSIFNIIWPISLLASVPTSFEGPFGKICYKIRAFIDTPRFSKDYKTQRLFYLLNVLNLNELPDIEVTLFFHFAFTWKTLASKNVI